MFDNYISQVSDGISNISGIGNILNSILPTYNTPAYKYSSNMSKTYSVGSEVSGLFNQIIPAEKRFIDLYNKFLFTEYTPDINGYTLAFLVPPIFMSKNNIFDNTSIVNFQKYICFAAIDYSPPTLEVQQESLNHNAGGIPYAISVDPGNSLNITFIENNTLDIYNFHHRWVYHIKQILKGTIAPDPSYVNIDSPDFGLLDYPGSLYIVKFDPSFTNILHISISVGVYPQGLPSKELIGQRSANELTTLPFTYFCSYYEETLDPNSWILKEFKSLIGII